MVSSGGVRVRQLALVAGVVALAGVVVLRLLGGPVPNPGWAGVVLLLFMAVGVLFAALPVKRLRERRVSPPGSALRAARSLVLAQAAALTGAGLLGWYAAQALVLLPDLDVESQRSRLWLLIGHAVAAVVLVASGLVAQRICRIDPPDSGEGGEAASNAGGVAPA
jgi:peptidoglycan/LPS O-acetylase OafA/YrhL